MSSTLKQIGIAIVRHGGNFLVGVRGADQVLAGCAEFPGGKCEPAESPQDCAVRECREETGLAVIAARELQQVRFSYPHGDVVLHFWLCRPADESQICADHQGFRWVPTGELAALNFPEANQGVIALLTAETQSRRD
jgi:mutator protein MutT